MADVVLNTQTHSLDEESATGKFELQQFDWSDHERGVPLHWEWDDHGKTNEISANLGAGGFSKSQKGALVRIALHAHHEALNMNRAIHYSRSKSAKVWYSPQTKRLPYYSYPLITHAIHFLQTHGFISHVTADAGVTGRQSEFRATSRLLMNVGMFRYNMLPPSQPIILRDQSGIELELPDTRVIYRMLKRVTAQNNLILETEFTVLPELKAPMRRIFLQDMKHHGRFYCTGSSWQNVRRGTRRLIELNGEKTTLLDFSACNPHIAYRLVGEVPPDEPYQCEGFGREDSKLALMILLNASDKREAVFALAYDNNFLSKHNFDKHYSDIIRRRRLAEQLIEELERLHAPLIEAKMFFGSGLRLMKAESDIADGVMTDLRKLGVVSLPIHDGFMVQERHSHLLEDSMRERSKMGTKTPIPISTEF